MSVKEGFAGLLQALPAEIAGDQKICVLENMA
jgi:hypothetical protein